MKLEAKMRLLAAPVSIGEQERFIEELMKLDPALAAGQYDETFGRQDLTKLVFKNKAAGLSAVEALKKHGWVPAGSWVNNPSLAKDFPRFAKNGEWPIDVRVTPISVSFSAPTNDRVGDDSVFKTALTKITKALMPGKAVIDLRAGTARWSKSGGHAGTGIMSKVIAKAKTLGFKPASAFGSAHPAGDWVSSDETFLHPDGWILSFGSSFGQTARQNSFWIQLSVDYRRGEDKVALSKLPQPGTCVRYRMPGSSSDDVGRVKELRNTRLLVERDNSSKWVPVTALKPMPKSGATVTYRNPRLNKDLTGVIDSVGPNYAVVKVNGHEDYVHYVNLRTVDGASWDWGE